MKTRLICLLLALISLPLAAQEPADTTSHQLGEATVRGTRLLFVTKKDTVVYDLDAVAATKGEMLGEVLRKLPGLELRDGVLYYRGKQVDRLLVNGTDFVRGDTQTALEQIPAYIVKNVKAYEGMSDQAKITGIDDGVRQQVVDVVLRREYHGVWAGNVDLGGATDHYYRLRGFANTFTDRFRLSVYAGLTNTAQYQQVGNTGDWDSNGGAGGSTGETTYKKPGFSMMWKNRDAEEGAGFFKIEASGYWDYRKHNDYHLDNAEYFLDEGSRFNAVWQHRRNWERIVGGQVVMTWKPTEHTHLEWTPGYAYTWTDDITDGRQGQWDTDVFAGGRSAIDSLYKYRDTGWPDQGATTFAQSHSVSSGHGHNYHHWLYGTHRLTESNWRLSLRNSLRYTRSTDRGGALTDYRYYQVQPDDSPTLLNRRTENRANGLNQMTFLDLNIPLKILQTLRLTYGYQTSQNDKDNLGYRLERMGGLFADFDAYMADFGRLPSADDWQTLCRDAEVTLNSDQGLRKHWAELYLQYKTERLYASLQSCTRFSYDKLDYLKGDYDPVRLRRHSREYVFHGQAIYGADSTGRVNGRLYYEIQPHGLSNFITLPDRSNPLNIWQGADYLPARHERTAEISYDRTFRSIRRVSVQARVVEEDHSLRTRSTYDPLTGITTRQPGTTDGNWYTQVTLSYNAPLDKEQRWNWHIVPRYNFSRNRDFYTATAGSSGLTTVRKHGFSVYSMLTARLGKFFGTLHANVQVDRMRNSQATGGRVNYLRQAYGTYLQYTLPLDIELKTSFTVTHQAGFDADGYNPVHCYWEATAGKSFLRDKSLTLQLEASDILNQREHGGLWQSPTERHNIWGNAVGRFLMLHLIYNFSTKK